MVFLDISIFLSVIKKGRKKLYQLLKNVIIKEVVIIDYSVSKVTADGLDVHRKEKKIEHIVKEKIPLTLLITFNFCQDVKNSVA